jgi:hypothetical protein
MIFFIVMQEGPIFLPREIIFLHFTGAIIPAFYYSMIACRLSGKLYRFDLVLLIDTKTAKGHENDIKIYIAG